MSSCPWNGFEYLDGQGLLKIKLRERSMESLPCAGSVVSTLQWPYPELEDWSGEDKGLSVAETRITTQLLVLNRKELHKLYLHSS